jgi:hypothetical protein
MNRFLSAAAWVWAVCGMAWGQPPAEPPKLEPYVIIEGDPISHPDVKTELRKVRSAEQDGDVFVITELDGSVTKLDAVLVRLVVDGPPGLDLPVPLSLCISKINTLLEAQRRFAPLKEPLQVLIDGWQAEADLIRSGKIKKKGQWIDPVDALKAELFSEAYDPKKNYSLEELEVKINKVEATLADYPGRLSDLEQELLPYRTELAYLRQGLVKVDGQWMEAADAGQAQTLAVQSGALDYTKKLELPEVESVIVPAAMIWKAGAVVGFLVLLFSLLFLFGLFDLFFRAKAVRGMGGLLFNGALLGGVAWIVWSASKSEPYTAPEADPSPLLASIQAMGSEKPPERVRIPATEVNGFIQRHVVWKKPDDRAIYALNSMALSVGFESGVLSVTEQGEFMGRPVLIRHRLEVLAEYSNMTRYRVRTTFGGLSLPNVVSAYFWKNCQARLVPVLRAIPGLADYHIAGASDGVLELSYTPTSGR